MKIWEVLGNSLVKHTLKPVNAKKPSSKTIKPINTIASKPALTPNKLRQNLLKQTVERAKEAVKHNRVVSRYNRGQ